MESRKSDVIVAKKGGAYGTDLLDYTGFILYDPEDEIRNRSALSPVKSTEVYQKLKNNQWLLKDTRYYVQGRADSDFDFQIRFTEFDSSNPKSADVDTLDDSLLSLSGSGFPVLSYIDEENISDINKARAYSLSMSFKDARNEMVNELYNTVFGSTTDGEGGENITLPSAEKVFYDSSKTRVSLSSGNSYLLELVNPGSDLYTNKISLGPLIQSDIFKPGMKCILDLSINFSKEGRIYARSSMFPVFTYTETGINKNAIDLEINNEIRVYFDQSTEILSIFKIDQSIDEYIIEGCTARIL